MSANKGIIVSTLIAHIEKQIVLLDGCREEIDGAKNEDVPKFGRTSRAAVLMETSARVSRNGRSNEWIAKFLSCIEPKSKWGEQQEQREMQGAAAIWS